MPRQIRLRPTSRYKSTRVYRQGREESFYGSWNPPTITPDETEDQFYHVKISDIGRLDQLAFKFYGDPALWWVLAQVNSITNPLAMVVDQILRIPSISRVNAITNETVFQERADA